MNAQRVVPLQGDFNLGGSDRFILCICVGLILEDSAVSVGTENKLLQLIWMSYLC